MARLSRLFFTLLVFCIAVCPGAFALSAEGDDEEGMLVGRISYVEGDLLRYVPEEKDWEATVEDAPFGLDDALYSSENAKAPNSSCPTAPGSGWMV